jgi:hypothetical protein
MRYCSAQIFCRSVMEFYQDFIVGKINKRSVNEGYQKSILSNYYLIIVRAPTTKAVGSIDVTKLEPTALVVGLI